MHGTQLSKNTHFIQYITFIIKEIKIAKSKNCIETVHSIRSTGRKHTSCNNVSYRAVVAWSLYHVATSTSKILSSDADAHKGNLTFNIYLHNNNLTHSCMNTSLYISLHQYNRTQTQTHNHICRVEGIITM